MPLLYRDTLRPRTAARTPDWLEGATDVQRLEGDAGDIVGHWDPMVFSPAQNAAGARWKALPGHWEVALLGDLTPDLLLRQDPDLPLVLPVEDGKGRIWRAPAVLAPDADPAHPSETGAVAMVLPWGRDETGSWCRIPDERQAPLIATARAVRAEAVAGRLMQTPMDVLAGWAATLMCGLYRLSPDVVAQLRLFDDKLIFGYCLASAGLAAGRG
jgi:hypothetical protein